MKVLTLHQPYATLMAIGDKRFETRGYPMPWSILGEQVAIHAAATVDTLRALRDDYEDGWEVAHLGDHVFCWQRLLVAPDDWQRGRSRMFVQRYGPTGDGPYDVPLGAIVATCRMVESIPCLSCDDPTSNVGYRCTSRALSSQFGQPDARSPHIARSRHDDSRLGLFVPDMEAHSTGRTVGYHRVWSCRDISDQEPYGDFTPGRHAWSTDLLQALDDPVPFVGGQGLTKSWEPPTPVTCYT